jgi:hypothetical protein
LNILKAPIALLIVVAANSSSAQCVNSVTPSCGVYDSCFSKLCACDSSPYEYFKSYGKRYCEVFLDLPKLSTKGKIWRDSTLRCLQESLVPKLPPDGQAASCNCQKMQTVAFDSHVACYTQASNSICSLSGNDWFLIFKASDPITSLKDQNSRKQMLEVAKICLPVAVAEAKAPIELLIKKLSP